MGKKNFACPLYHERIHLCIEYLCALTQKCTVFESHVKDKCKLDGEGA